MIPESLFCSSVRRAIGGRTQISADRKEDKGNEEAQRGKLIIGNIPSFPKTYCEVRIVNNTATPRGPFPWGNVQNLQAELCIMKCYQKQKKM